MASSPSGDCYRNEQAVLENFSQTGGRQAVQGLLSIWPGLVSRSQWDTRNGPSIDPWTYSVDCIVGNVMVHEPAPC